MGSERKRTIKISAEAYQALSDRAKEEKKSMEEIASAAIFAMASAELGTTPGYSSGEQYGPDGKRIFRRS